VKIHLGIALALHAAVLGAGARWPRPKQVQRAPDATEDIVVEEAPVPAPAPAPVSGVPAENREPGRADPLEHRRARPAPLVQHRAPLPASTGGAPVAAAPAGGPSGGSAESGGPSAGEGEGGAGDGAGAAAAAGRPRRRALGERWDAVGGPRAEEAPAQTAEADESTLPRREIEHVVALSAPRLRRCYEDGLRRDPDLAGQIPVRFVVDPGGGVLVASDAGSTVADPAVVRCVLAAFAAMAFPPPRRGEAVRATHLVALPPG
jgi:hypothetical protein